ncbi:MAG TPA: anti-sigma factor [Bryobacteraceae bacterium]|nr:anti-sigma factor [Bryobacteraceae bacterium]
MNDLSEYLDESLDREIREKLQKHVSECPNCWVILDTTQRTIKVYKGMEPQSIPTEIHTRLMEAVTRKLAATRKT